jgi:hypothetical protein
MAVSIETEDYNDISRRDTICARPNFKAPLSTGRNSGWDHEEDKKFEARFSTLPAKGISEDSKQEESKS